MPRPGKGGNAVADDDAPFSREAYLRMDAAFAKRLERAIRRREERAPVGVSKRRRPARSVPLRLHGEATVSITGSTAGECADIGAYGMPAEAEPGSREE